MSSISQKHSDEKTLIDCVQRFFPRTQFFVSLIRQKRTGFVFTSLLAADIVNYDIRDLTNRERKMYSPLMTAFFGRTSCKKTELGSKVF